MSEKNIEIGRRIKQRREELGLTQEDLGKALWLNKSTIQRYETGKISSIKLPVIHAMAKQLNVNPDWLILKTEDMGCFTPMFDEYSEAMEVEKMPEELVLLNRAGKNMSSEDRKKLLEMAKVMFKEAFDD